MKKRTILIYIGIFIVVIAAIFIGYQIQARETTTIEITSVSPLDPKDGESVRVNYRVFGGANDFSIVVLPDTQYYSQSYPSLYYAQTRWIVENRYAHNILFVSHLGDIVNDNDLYEQEWRVADTAMSELDGVIPYGILAGNHDMQVGGTAQFYKKYFPDSRFQDYSWWGGSFNDNKNNYQLISAPGQKFIILHLQYCPPDSAIDWANEVLSNYSGYKAIISTHSYLLDDGKRVGHCKDTTDGNNSGFDIWKNVVRKNTNIFMVLSGHIPGAARRTDHVDGRVVYQLLSDYQEMTHGGEGYLRIMTFQPNLDNIEVITYSPVLDSFLTDPENQFDLHFDMAGGRLPSGKVTIRNGADHCEVAVETGYCEFVVTDPDAMSISAAYSGDIYFEGSESE